MENPAPVDLNKLKSILGNAKKLMAVTEQKFPSKPTSGGGSGRVNEDYGHSQQSAPIYDERDEREPQYPTYSNQAPSVQLVPQQRHRSRRFQPELPMQFSDHRRVQRR